MLFVSSHCLSVSVPNGYILTFLSYHYVDVLFVCVAISYVCNTFGFVVVAISCVFYVDLTMYVSHITMYLPLLATQ